MYNIHRHLNYSAWATGKIVEMLQNVDEALWDKEVISSFPTIRKTLYHIWDAEVIWYERMKGGEVMVWPSTTFNGSNEEFLKLYLAHSNELAAFITTKDTAFLESKINYKNMKGIEYSTPVEEILFHLVNHGSYHRGQLITMLRTLGFTQIVNTDLIAYVRLHPQN
jgi:uncharacterized damage-inducible protein DinB